MYTRILVPLDGSELAECIFSHVDTILNGCGVVELVLARVLEPLQLAPYADADGFMGSKDIEKILMAQETDARNYLEKTQRRFQRPGLKIRTELLNGQVADTLTDYAKKENFDLIIMATHGYTGFKRLVLGSVASGVVNQSSVPVLLIRPDACRL